MRIHLTVALLCCAVAGQAAEPAAATAPKPAVPATADTPATPATAPGREARDRIGPEAASRAAGARSTDRVDLDTTVVTGNRELPRVLYVVPWKRADLGDAGGRPANSLLDEVLTPVDREVFRRQNRYYRALQPDGAAPAGSAPANGEK